MRVMKAIIVAKEFFSVFIKEVERSFAHTKQVIFLGICCHCAGPKGFYRLFIKWEPIARRITVAITDRKALLLL